MNSPIDFNNSLSLFFFSPLDSLWFPGIELTPAKNNNFFLIYVYAFILSWQHQVTGVRVGSFLLFAWLFGLVSPKDSASQIPLRILGPKLQFLAHWALIAVGNGSQECYGVRGFLGSGLTRLVDL